MGKGGKRVIVWVSPLLSKFVVSSLILILWTICLFPEFDRNSKVIDKVEPTLCLMNSHVLTLALKTTIVLIRPANTNQEIVRSTRRKRGDGTVGYLLNGKGCLGASSFFLVGPLGHWLLSFFFPSGTSSALFVPLSCFFPLSRVCKKRNRV